MEAAGRLFDAQGFAGTSIAEIADEAGYTTGALYSNFANKEDLFLAVVERQVEDEMAALATELSALPTAAARVALVGSWYASHAGRGRRRTRALAEVALLAQDRVAARERLRQQREGLRHAVAELLRQQEDELGIEFRAPNATLATAVLALLEGFALSAAMDEDVATADVVAALDLLLRPAARATGAPPPAP